MCVLEVASGDDDALYTTVPGSLQDGVEVGLMVMFAAIYTLVHAVCEVGTDVDEVVRHSELRAEHGGAVNGMGRDQRAF